MELVTTNKNGWMFQVLQVATLVTVVVGTLRDNQFSFETCIQADKLTSSLKFFVVSSKLDCATKCDDKCAAFVIKRKSGRKMCALISSKNDIPSEHPGYCKDKESAKARVYKNLEFQEPCDGEVITAFEHKYCVLDILKTAMSFFEARSMCEERGGQLPEVEFEKDLNKITAGNTVVKSIWMGAENIDLDGVYEWPNGNQMPQELLRNLHFYDVSKRPCVMLRRGGLHGYPCGAEERNVVCFLEMI